MSGAAIAMHYITFDLEGDLLALLLLVYTHMKTDIQESSTYILTYVEKNMKAFLCTFQGFSLA